MAQLKRPLNGGPLYLRGAGPGRRGTWHISQEGENWLLQQNYLLPASGHETFLSRDKICHLEPYFYKFNIIYDKPLRIVPSSEREHKGLPLLLRLGGKHEAVAPWMLSIELAKLEEAARKELGRDRVMVTSATVHGTLRSDASTLGMRQLQDVLCWPQVVPRLEPYRILWQGSQGLQHELSPTPGLHSGWSGNIFVKCRDGQLAGTWWQRCLPNESISDTDCAEFYWLAQPGYEPEWPALAQPVRGLFRGWQLWKLSIDGSIPIPWEMIEEWLDNREIDLIYSSWHLRVLNPLTFIAPKQYTVAPGQPLLVRCDPPRQQQQPGTLPQRILLAASPTPRLSSHTRTQQSAPINSALLQPTQENYFCLWTLEVQEEYRVQLKGEVTGASLYVQIAPISAILPSWLQGLSITLETARTTRSLQAFNNSQQGDQPLVIRVPEDLPRGNLPDLKWRLEPAGIPFSWEWGYELSQGQQYRDRLEGLKTESDLSLLWAERIWPAIAANSRTKIVFDAGSFGYIELALICSPEQASDAIWWDNRQLSSQLLWLSRASWETLSRQVECPVPASLRKWLQQSGQVKQIPQPIRGALKRLEARESMPAWVIARLQVMLAAIQNKRVPDQFAGH